MARKDKDISIENLSVDSEGQLQFEDVDNYYPVASDYGRIPKPFIERFTNVSYLANLGLMLAIQNIEIRNKNYYVGTSEEAYYSDIYRKTKTDYSEGLVSCIPVSKYISIYGLNRGGTTYASLDALYNGDALRNQWQILYEDDKIISGTSVLTGTMYDKQTKCLYMKFNPDLAPIITNIQKNYALISLPVLGKLKEDYIAQLYQILKEKHDIEESKNKLFGYAYRQEIEIEYDIDKLLFLMGMYPLDLTSDDSGMQMAAMQVKAQNYKEAARILKERHLIEKNISEPMHIKALYDYRDFSRVYLAKCFTRINGFRKPAKLERVDAEDWDKVFDQYASMCKEKHPTDIHFRYSYRRGGLGGKVISIIFYVSKADWSKEENVAATYSAPATNVSEALTDEQYAIIDDIRDLISEKISSKGAADIGRTAGWDINKVKTAYEVARTYNKPINDLVAFMIKAITGGWEPAVAVPAERGGEEVKEEYPMEVLRERLGYADALRMKPDYEESLNYFMDVIYETMNSDAKTVKIGSGRMPAHTVQDKIMQLNAKNINDAITAFLEGNESRNVSSSYILTILYKIKMQEGLKQEKERYTEKKGRSSASNARERYGYQQREYTDEQLKAIERKKLGLPPEGSSESPDTYIPDTTNKFNRFPQTVYTQADYDDLEFRKLFENEKSKKGKKNAFNDFSSRTYTTADYNDLEARRLGPEYE